MRAMLPTAGEAAISDAPSSGSEFKIQPGSRSVFEFTPGSESDDWDWFAPVAWKVLGTKDTGAILHEITGYPLSTCRAYVAKDRSGRRAPTMHFFRRLARTKVGRPFVDAFMADCPWFCDFQHAAFIGEQVLALTKRG